MSQPLVLVVDDDPNDVLLVRRSLNKLGPDVAVQAVEDGAQALDLLLEGASGARAIRPDLVLLDLKMPFVNGFEVLERLRASSQTNDLRIVVFSSSNEDRDVERARRLGADDVVRKPIDFAEFSRTVSQTVARWIRSPRPDERRPEPTPGFSSRGAFAAAPLGT